MAKKTEGTTRWRVVGPGFSHDFPRSMETRNYQSRQQVITRPNHGEQGSPDIVGRGRQFPTTIRFSGYFKGANVQASLDQLRDMQAAIIQPTQALYLIDLRASPNRRVKCRLADSNVPREADARYFASLTFQTVGEPQWEEVTPTNSFPGNPATVHWVDLESGDKPQQPLLKIDGRHAGVSLVQGNFSLLANFDNSPTVQALNTKPLQSPWGIVNPVIQAASSGGGSFGSGNFFTIDTFEDGHDPFAPTNIGTKTWLKGMTDVYNRQQGHFSVDVSPNWDSADTAAGTFYVFQTSNDTPQELYWNSPGGHWVFSDGDITVTLVDTFNSSVNPDTFRNIQLSWASLGSVHANNNLIMWVNAVDTVTSRSAAVPAGAKYNPGTKIWVGSDRESANEFEGTMMDMGWWLSPIHTQQTVTNMSSGFALDSEWKPHAWFPLRSGIAATSAGSRDYIRLTVATIADQTLSVNTGALKFLLNEQIAVWDRTGKIAHVQVSATPPDDRTIPIKDFNTGLGVTTLINIGTNRTFNGTDHKYQASLSTTGDITTGDVGFAAWVRSTASGKIQTVFAKSTGGSGTGYWGYVTAAGSPAWLATDTSGNSDNLITTKNVTDGDWHIIEWMLDKGVPDLLIFVDGVQGGRTSTPLVTDSMGNNKKLTLGARSDATLFWNGDMRDMRMWGAGTDSIWSSFNDMRFDAAEMAGHVLEAYKMQSKTKAETGWWKLNEAGSATMALDSSGNGKDFIASGSTPLGIARTPVYVSDSLISDNDTQLASCGDWQTVEGDTQAREKTESSTRNWYTPRHWDMGLAWDDAVKRTSFGQAGEKYVIECHFDASQGKISVWDITKATMVIGTIGMKSVVNGPVRWAAGVISIPTSTPTLHELGIVFDNARTAPAGTDPHDIYSINMYHIKQGTDAEATSEMNEEGTPFLVTTSTDEHSGVNAIQVQTDAADEGLNTLMVLPSSMATHWLESVWYGETGSGGEVVNFSGFEALSGAGTPIVRQSVLTFPNDVYRPFWLINKLGSTTQGTFAVKAPNSVTFRFDDWSVRRRTQINVDTNAAAAAVAGAYPNLVISKYGTGRNFDGGTYTIPSLVQRPDRISFVARMRMNTDSTVAERFIFDLARGTSTQGTHDWFLKRTQTGGTARWVFGNSKATIGGAATGFVNHKDIEVAGYAWAQASTIKAALWEQGLAIASLRTFNMASVPTLTRLSVGTDRQSANAAFIIMDQLALLHQYPGDQWFVGNPFEQRPLHADNHVFSWASTIPTNVFVVFQPTLQKITKTDLTDEQVPVVTSGILKPGSSNYVTIGRGRGHGHSMLDTIYSPHPLVGEIQYRRNWSY